MSTVQGKSPFVQVKERYGNLDMVTCRLSSWSVQSTPAHNARNGIRQYIEKERITADMLSGHSDENVLNFISLR